MLYLAHKAVTFYKVSEKTLYSFIHSLIHSLTHSKIFTEHPLCAKHVVCGTWTTLVKKTAKGRGRAYQPQVCPKKPITESLPQVYTIFPETQTPHTITHIPQKISSGYMAGDSLLACSNSAES